MRGRVVFLSPVFNQSVEHPLDLVGRRFPRYLVDDLQDLRLRQVETEKDGATFADLQAQGAGLGVAPTSTGSRS